ncbi:DUF5658 family protein [Rossellomorea vietnamensis]|uniref:DUF5658 family protein n=1 Tax=Rossellomorea vietnamensis TaxID=218284 RepID=UPI003CE7EF59
MKLVIHFLALLNILDGALTLIGLEGEYIEEANPLMAILYSIHPLLFISVKCLFSVLLYIIVFYDLFPAKRWFAAITVLAVTLYCFVVAYHGVWVLHFMSLN